MTRIHSDAKWRSGVAESRINSVMGLLSWMSGLCALLGVACFCAFVRLVVERWVW